MKTEILESLLQSVNALTQTLNLLLNEQSETPPQSTSSTATLTTSERLKKQEAAKAKAAAKKAATKTASETPKDTKDPKGPKTRPIFLAWKPAESEASEPLTVGEVKKLAGTYVSSHSLAEFKELMVGLDIKDISAADKAGRLQEIVDAINADE
jgi:hypothetical protein